MADKKIKTKKAKTRMSGDERKGQIVEVATRLFSENGFRGTTTREIAKAAGISEAVIFKYFSKKEDLYRAIIDRRCSDSAGESRLITGLKGKKGRDVFYDIANYMLEEHRKAPSFMRLLTFSALEKHELSKIFIKTKAMELLEFIEDEIKGLMEAGEMRKGDSALAARAFMGMVLHYCVSQELYGLKRYFKRTNEAVAKTFVDIFFEGMKRR